MAVKTFSTLIVFNRQPEVSSLNDILQWHAGWTQQIDFQVVPGLWKPNESVRKHPKWMRIFFRRCSHVLLISFMCSTACTTKWRMTTTSHWTTTKTNGLLYSSTRDSITKAIRMFNMCMWCFLSDMPRAKRTLPLQYVLAHYYYRTAFQACNITHFLVPN